MACIATFDLVKPEPTVIRITNRRKQNPITMEHGDETALTSEGVRYGALAAQVQLGLLDPGMPMSREKSVFIAALCTGMAAVQAEFAAARGGLPAPAKTRKPPREFRRLEPPLSEAGNRIFVAADLEYTLEFPWCARIIRDRFRAVPGVDPLPRPEQLHKDDYNSVRIPEPIAYRVWQQRLEEQRLKQKQIEQQQLRRRRK
jgi:hypothetical protein